MNDQTNGHHVLSFTTWKKTHFDNNLFQKDQEIRNQEIQAQQQAQLESIRRQADSLLSAERARTDAVRLRMGLPSDHMPVVPLSESLCFSARVTPVKDGCPRPDTTVTALSSWSSVDTHTPRELRAVYPFTPEPTPVPTPRDPPKTTVSKIPVLQKRPKPESKTRVSRLPVLQKGLKANVSNGQTSHQQVPSLCSPQTLSMVPKPPTGPRPKTHNVRPGRTLGPAQEDWQQQYNTECASEMSTQAPVMVPTPPTGPKPNKHRTCSVKTLKPAQKQEKLTERRRQTVNQDTESDHKPLENPEISLTLAFEWIRSGDWSKKIDGLKTVESLVRHHRCTLLPKLHEICVAVMEEIKNLRSAVACAAIHTIADLYAHLKSIINPEVEHTCRSLLLRLAQDSSAFIHEQVNTALDTLVENCNQRRVVTALLNTGLSHRCIAVRTSTAEHLKKVLDKVGADTIFAVDKGYTERFLVAICTLAVDAASDVRCFGVQILKDLAQHQDFLSFWENNVPQKDRRRLDKILKNLKPH